MRKELILFFISNIGGWPKYYLGNGPSGRCYQEAISKNIIIKGLSLAKLLSNITRALLGGMADVARKLIAGVEEYVALGVAIGTRTKRKI